MIRRLTLGATLVAAGCGTLPHDADPIPGSRRTIPVAAPRAAVLMYRLTG